MKLTIIGSIAIAALVGASIAATQNTADKKLASPPKAPAAPEMPQLPPGMTAEDMQAYMEAGTPGEMHKHLMKGVGVWEGKTKSWMTPDAPPIESTCVSKVSGIMGDKFVKTEVTGDFPGMGPWEGLGINGFDNVSKTFQATWLGSDSTGMMQGTGSLSSDGKVMTWTFNCNCPLTKKPMVMREVDTMTGPNSMKLEMFGPHPKSGKEYKMMEIAFTRKGTATATGSER
jgi:Protein of unknown function (DUF1579)